MRDFDYMFTALAYREGARGQAFRRAPPSDPPTVHAVDVSTAPQQHVAGEERGPDESNRDVVLQRYVRELMHQSDRRRR